MTINNKWIVFGSAYLGFVYGLLHPTLLWTLEAAQILAKTVVVPPDNPMGMFYRSLYAPWMVWPAALLLNKGVSIINVAVFYSGLQGAISFATVTYLTLIFSQNRLFALLLPVFMTRLHYSLYVVHKYPIFFPVNSNDAGMWGFYMSLLIIALISAGSFRIGPLLLGLLPSIHITLAVAIYIGVFVNYLFGGAEVRKAYKASLRWFGLGAVITGLSLLIQLLLFRNTAHLGSDQDRMLVNAFMNYWDWHRSPFLYYLDIVGRIQYFESELFLLFISLFFLVRYKTFVQKEVQSVIRMLLGISIIGSMTTLVNEIWPSFFPIYIKSLMIYRWLNVNTFILPLLLLGMMARFAVIKRSVVAFIFLILILVDMSWGTFSHVLFPSLRILFFVTIAFLELEYRGVHIWVSKLTSVTRALVIISGLIVAVYILVNTGTKNTSSLLGSSSDIKVFEAAQKRDGVVIVAHNVTDWPQLKLNRGVLLYTDLMDVMPYVPEAATKIEEILNKVYNVSIYDRRNWQAFDGLKERWESMKIHEWQKLGKQFAAGTVLTRVDWTLHLPKIAESENFILYEIPR